MSEFFSQIDWDAMIVAIQETFIMTIISLVIAVILLSLIHIFLSPSRTCDKDVAGSFKVL